MIKGIIFSLQQTLVRFTGEWETVVQEGAAAMSGWYLKKARIKVDQTALVNAFISERKAGRVLAYQTNREVTAAQSLHEALKKIDAPARAESVIADAIKAYFEVEEAHWVRYPETLDTLKQLKAAGYQLGMYANHSDDASLQRILNRCRLRPWLSPTFSSARWGWRTPKPDPFTLIAKRWQLAPTEVMVVGNTLNSEILAAQTADMPSVLVTQEAAPSNENHPDISPTATIPNLLTLPGVLGI